MAERFVYIKDDFQEWLRVRSRQTPLVTYHRRDPWYNDKRGTPLYVIHDISQLTMQEELARPERFKQAESQIMKLREQKLQVEADTEFRSYISRRRSIEATIGIDMVSEELLAYGAGLLRKVYTADQYEERMEVAEKFGIPATLSELLTGITVPVGKLNSKFIQVYGNIILSYIYDTNRRVVEPWESTNIILGDAYGELEQLQRRKHEIKFLNEVAHVLTVTLTPWTTEDTMLIADKTLTREEFVRLVKAHLRMQSLWPSPPESGKELSDRVDHILSHTNIDTTATRINKIRPMNLRSKTA